MRAVKGSQVIFGMRTYFKKYCSPALLFSRNLGWNLCKMLLGGIRGTAASKFGKVWTRRFLRLSNSEYRFLMFIREPYKTEVAEG